MAYIEDADASFLVIKRTLMNLTQISNTVLITPIFEFLKFLTVSTGNFGIAIILLTLIIRTILIPLSLPTLRSMKKMRLLKPELDKLKKQYGKDVKKFQEAQLQLYKKNNINPLSGCLPYVLQFVVLIALYNVLRNFVTRATGMGVHVNPFFLGLDLSKIDHTRILPILAAVTQLVLSVMLLPGVESHDLIPDNAKSKKLKIANEKETNSQEMADTMQKQMVFMMPIFTGWIALNFPAGLALYWVATTIFSAVQQWAISGPGGLEVVWHSVKRKISKFGGKTL